MSVENQGAGRTELQMPCQAQLHNSALSPVFTHQQKGICLKSNKTNINSHANCSKIHHLYKRKTRNKPLLTLVDLARMLPTASWWYSGGVTSGCWRMVNRFMVLYVFLMYILTWLMQCIAWHSFLQSQSFRNFFSGLQ